jgi:hypothetical protein
MVVAGCTVAHHWVRRKVNLTAITKLEIKQRKPLQTDGWLLKYCKWREKNLDEMDAN